MPIFSFLRRSGHPPAYQAITGTLPLRLWEVTTGFWDLGFTAFGGPPVHFQILHHRFVDCTIPWLDEQTYQELFAISQGLPGPGSTKLGFCIALLHAGFVPAVWAFILWSLPGAIGMFALALGVQRIGEVLPDPVYALLSGLNASTVGIIAVAAVQLAEKSIKDDLTRILVIMGACAGIPYSALWYFPLLIAIGGTTAVVWDLWARARVGRMKARWRRRRRSVGAEAGESAQADAGAVPLEEVPSSSGVGAGTVGVQRRSRSSKDGEEGAQDPASAVPPQGIDTVSHAIPVKVGILIILVFFASFIAFMTVRGTLSSPPLELDLFTNMYLAGTIIFGGGPVVIPLLREYVVEPGWVSSRDFLLGLAIIQAFPGPNFNFAVYLGALTLSNSTTTTTHSSVGALLGFLGIFLPGLTVAISTQSIWRVLRSKPLVVSLLRGVNATAVGLVFTAVYRLWEIGYLKGANGGGSGSLGEEPWWVVVVGVTYSVVMWWGVPPAVAILGGAAAGVAWWGVVR